VAVLDDGSALVHTAATGTLTHIDPSGQIVSATPLGLKWMIVHASHDAFLGVDASGALAKVVTASYVNRTFAPAATGQNTQTKTMVVTIAPLPDYQSNNPPPFTGESARSALQTAVGDSATVQLDTFIGAEATLLQFRTSVGDLPTVGPALDDPRAELVGVIAHAVERPDTRASVGYSVFRSRFNQAGRHSPGAAASMGQPEGA
jgi:hypothetical protein